MNPLLPALAALLLAAPALRAEIFYVNSIQGNDTQAGTAENAALRTIAKALAAARPGDSIQLVSGQPPIHETIGLKNRSGEPGRPIVIDGGNNVLTGLAPLAPKEWTEVRPGLHRSPKALSASQLRRWFFRFGGGIVRMGRSSKGDQPPLPKPGALKPGEWTYAPEEAALYIALPPGQPLAEAGVEAPVLQNGVAASGVCAHWVVRNLHVRHFLNDGFNFHGETSDFVLENVSATECGDDGMSAHERCQVEVRGFTARRNSTGICHINASSSVNSHVTLEANHGKNLFLLGSGTHTFTDSALPKEGVRIGGSKADSVILRLINCQWHPETALIEPGCRVETAPQ